LKGDFQPMVTLMKRILVVDDDLMVRDLLRATLSRNGYDANAASGWKEAKQIVGSEPPDIVVLDMYMPDVDGLEVLAHLRKALPEVRIIAMSGGMGKGNLLATATKLGAGWSLEKPFTPQELLQAIEALTD